MQNFNNEMRLGNFLAAGKEPVGDFPCGKKVLTVLQVLFQKQFNS
jgi:hypothetical protein